MNYTIDQKLSNLITRKYDNTGLVISIEECAELQKTLTKKIRGKGNKNNIAEEIGDVLICIDWIQHILDISDEEIQKWINYKNARTLHLIEKGEFK